MVSEYKADFYTEIQKQNCSVEYKAVQWIWLSINVPSSRVKIKIMHFHTVSIDKPFNVFFPFHVQFQTKWVSDTRCTFMHFPIAYCTDRSSRLPLFYSEIRALELSNTLSPQYNLFTPHANKALSLLEAHIVDTYTVPAQSELTGDWWTNLAENSQQLCLNTPSLCSTDNV